MPAIEVTHHFSVSGGHLYAAICDMNSWGDWFSLHGEFVGEPPTKLFTNSRYVQIIHIMGMPFTIEFVVTEFRPPLAVVVTGRGPAGLLCNFTFSARRADGGRGTILSLSGDFDTPMLDAENAELQQLLIESCTKQLSTSLDRLQTVAESRAAARLAE